MSFETVAKHIIKNSIVSSLYIDDKVIEPFETPKNGDAYFEISKGLYSSFRKEKKSLDFYKFKKRKSWRNDSNYLFKNRDLLILDWQLDSATGLIQPKTLEILQKAVETDNLHFVSIYTETESDSFPDILYSVKAFFTKEYNAETKALCENFKNYIEELALENYDLEQIGILKEASLNREEGINSLNEIKKSIQKEIGAANIRNFCGELKKIDSDIKKAIEIFGFYLNEESNNDNLPYNCSFNFNHTDKNFIVINHTIIKLSNKQNPEPEDFFADFTEAMIKICGNPLTLTSLEIRTLMREGSGFIGKDADSIKDAALFHHKELKAGSFFNFILEIWKSYLLSYVDAKTTNLQTFTNDFWEGYKNDNNVDQKLIDLKTDENKFYLELGKLNTYYNKLHLAKGKSDIIKFGDIFVELDDEGNETGDYWLNITAHCDCERPKENIKNNFSFTRGQKMNLKDGLTKSDEGFRSYLNKKEEVLLIDWKSRIHVLNISNNKMKNYLVNVKDGTARKFKLRYIATLKENYAQRMANNSFSFAMRVGIDFAGLI